jgi:DNA-binding Lrp family transcriptional regulator
MEKLDSIDFKILAHLQENGRATNIALADAVCLTPSPCLQRVKRLENIGLIRSYGARLALGMIGEHVVVFTEVTLTSHRTSRFDKFLDFARQFPEVMECHHVTGGYDYLLRIVARSVAHYSRIIEQLLEGNVGIGKISSYVVLSSPIERDSLPLKEMFDTDSS